MKAIEGLSPQIGTSAACRSLGVPRATLYRRRRPSLPVPAVPRSKPPRALCEQERQQVLDVLDSAPFADKAPAEVYAALLDQGQYLCSIRTMYRVLDSRKEVRERRDQLRQDAGMKYLVITSKHHDGFAMFGSKADAFSIVDATPFKRDPMKELAAACAKRGIKFGFYYSQAQDWHAPGGAIWEGPHEDDPVWEKPQWDPRQAGDFETYFNTKAIPQVRELLSNYGPISIIWFDTPLKVMTVDRAARLEKVVHESQPGCLISGRLGGKSQSDYASEGDNVIPNLSRAGLGDPGHAQRHLGLQEERP